MHLQSRDRTITVESSADPLVACLQCCVSDLERHSRSAAVLVRIAIERLGAETSATMLPGSSPTTEKAALLAYLQYLLPELNMRSTGAAFFVRQSIDVLERSMSRVPPVVALH